VANDVGGNDPGSNWGRSALEEDLSVDVQVRGGTARGQDQILVAEGVTTIVGATEGPRQLGLERGPLDGPGKPIVRSLCRPDPCIQLRKASVVGLVQGE